MKKKEDGGKVTRANRGAILLIACLLGSSAVLRLGLSATQVFAEGAVVEKAAMEEKPVEAQPAVDRDTLSTLLASLQERERALEEREKEVAMRMQAMKMAREEIDKKLAHLEQVEEELRSTIALANSAAEEDLARLTAVYENMKPKDAAGLFEEMDADFAAGFLSRMRPDAAASIMTGLTPQKAYTISVVLAGRNADIPKD